MNAAERVYVVDDDPFQLCLLSGMLRAAGHSVEVFEQPERLLAHLTPRDRGCIVLDLQMPGLTGLDLQGALTARDLRVPIVFVSGLADIPSVVRAMKAGALDFLTKPVSENALLDAVARATARDRAFAAERASRADARARWASLSARERDVCRLFARGMLNKQIGAELNITESTAQAHRARALQKLRVSTATEAAELLARLGDGGEAGDHPFSA